MKIVEKANNLEKKIQFTIPPTKEKYTTELFYEKKKKTFYCDK
jgi:hypothetical protein